MGEIKRNTVCFGDCIEVMKDISDGSIDMILCDLPYGKTKNKWDAVIDPTKLWEQYERVIKDNGAIVLFGQDKFTAAMMLSNPKLHRYNLIWDKVLKTGFLNANKMPLRQHEDIMVFYKKTPTYNPQKVRGKPLHSVGKAVGNGANQQNYGAFSVVQPNMDGMKHPSSILTYQKPHPSIAIHPTEKPVDLCRYLIRTYSNPADLVLDSCCGSGSILIAAKLENRDYIGIDNGYCENPKSSFFKQSWVDVAQQRIDNISVSQGA